MATVEVLEGGQLQAQRDAHLIAAAPDLLEALLSARDLILAGLPADLKAPGYDVDAFLERIDAAIAKAEGGKSP